MVVGKPFTIDDSVPRQYIITQISNKFIWFNLIGMTFFRPPYKSTILYPPLNNSILHNYFFLPLLQCSHPLPLSLNRALLISGVVVEQLTVL